MENEFEFENDETQLNETYETKTKKGEIEDVDVPDDKLKENLLSL